MTLILFIFSILLLSPLTFHVNPIRESMFETLVLSLLGTKLTSGFLFQPPKRDEFRKIPFKLFWTLLEKVGSILAWTPPAT